MLNIKKFVFSAFAENTYVLWDDVSNETAIIDPGCNDKNEEDILSNYIEENNLSVKYILITHCHIDHIFGNKFVKEKYNCPLLVPEKDEYLMDLMIDVAKGYGVNFTASPKADGYLSENEILKLGDEEIKILSTPGHSPGEVCLYSEKNKICITGDVLFKESIGRTDLWEGNLDTLIESIKTKLLTLPGDTKIYPGHGEASTIEMEILNNPFLKR
ncbi:MAG: MBL fold metallo-hydrolase [Melioribacteraceae bacterium]|nr:MBL fold metallo-hydrolase [Melioribacteraceae bacterium]